MNMNGGLKLERPLVFFDLETTGVDVSRDRIVQMAVLRCVQEEGLSKLRGYCVWLLDPGIPIPAMATSIHGISDEDVIGKPGLEDVADDILALFEDADVCGHNVIRFDLPLLKAEMKRVGIEFAVDGEVIDTLRIFQARFRHTLECAYRLYVGRPMEGAHDAGADTRALFEILNGMLNEYPDMPREPGMIARTPPSPDYVDAEGKFVWVGNEAVFSFGESTRGQSLRDVARDNRGFLNWMLGKDFDTTTLRIVRQALKGEFPIREVRDAD